MAKLLNRLLYEEKRSIYLLRLKCLKTNYGSRNILDDTPRHLLEDIGDFCFSGIVTGPLVVTPKDSEPFEVTNYENVVTIFNKA